MFKVISVEELARYLKIATGANNGRLKRREDMIALLILSWLGQRPLSETLHLKLENFAVDNERRELIITGKRIRSFSFDEPFVPELVEWLEIKRVAFADSNLSLFGFEPLPQVPRYQKSPDSIQGARRVRDAVLRNRERTWERRLRRLNEKLHPSDKEAWLTFTRLMHGRGATKNGRN